jgi:hypothetical protein
MHACRPHIRTLCISAYSRQGVGKRAYSPQVRIFADVLHIHAYSSLMRIFITNTHIRRHHAYSRIFTDTLHIRAYSSLMRIFTDTAHMHHWRAYAPTRRILAHLPCTRILVDTQHTRLEARTLPRRFPEPANTAFRLVVFAQVFSRAC